MQVVRHLPAMLAHLDLCWSLGRGDVRALIRQVTTDAAMLVFLDGATSKGTAPNENFGRELLELYTVGVGNFTEADVKAAAAALTGWVVRRRDGWKVRFVPARHDDTPQTLLGVDGVHDADTTIAAATSSPACPVFLAEARPVPPRRHRRRNGPLLAATFANADLDISALAGRHSTLVSVGRDTNRSRAAPWLLQAIKATGAAVDRRVG